MSIATHHQEWLSQDQFAVIQQLGLQIRRAVQILIQRIDRIDRERQRTLLNGFTEATLYHAAITVMMRLVFLLAAEERNLLFIDHDIFAARYSISTLHDQLRLIADKHGEDALKRRYDAWSRLAATFRAVYAGATHEDLRLPAHGGALFDPDRFPFLEGRVSGSSWKNSANDSAPLPIDDSTVLRLLQSLQRPKKKKGTNDHETNRLSFQALGVEAIGGVYEGLLDQTVKRAKGPVLFLSGGQEIEVELLEEYATKTPEKVAQRIAHFTGRTIGSVKKNLEYKVPREDERHWLVACDNARDVYKRIEPWAGLVRKEAEKPVIVCPGNVYITAGNERRATGTHYTPPSLTEPIVKQTLESLVYFGPSESWPENEWKLRPARDILMLKICDLAMGAGAFLLQACRYLSERLVETWDAAENVAREKLVMTPEGEFLAATPAQSFLPINPDERLALAAQYVADRCLYGVDKNPMAVEMAKLSLWLMTLQKDRPFTFVDHALKCGDSLLGISSFKQIEQFHLRPAIKTNSLLDGDAPNEATEDIHLVADVLIGVALSTATKGNKALDEKLGELEPLAREFLKSRNAELRSDLQKRAAEMLNGGRAPKHPLRNPFHWVLEFPEVFAERAGFDAFVGNPPFFWGNRIGRVFGDQYRDFLLRFYEGSRGNSDIVAYFLRQCYDHLRPGGNLGLLATNSIAEAETRIAGLDYIVKSGGCIYAADRVVQWSGMANVRISKIFVRRGPRPAPYLLDGRFVASIGTDLREEKSALRPVPLRERAKQSFKGVDFGGTGFILTPDEYETILHESPQESRYIWPVLNAVTFANSPALAPMERIINFSGMTLNDAEAAVQCMAIVKERVLPKRKLDNRKAYRDRWWVYNEARSGLYQSINGLSRVLVNPAHAKYLTFGFCPARIVFTNALNVFPLDHDSFFSVLQCRVHEVWALKFASSIRDDLRYTPSTCFETFPFPQQWETHQKLEAIGKTYYDFRAALMIKNNEGLTKTYNRFHHPEERSPDIWQLRKLHADMDRVVLDAYGFTGISPIYDFRQQLGASIRYTWSDETRDEILEKLLELNQQRHREEIRVDSPTTTPKAKTLRRRNSGPEGKTS